jgi:hypothetical protein
MNAIYAPFVEAANAAQVDHLNKSKAVAAAVAMAVASMQPLPSSEVSEPSGYYNQTHAISARQLVGELNEEFIFDVTYAIALARAFWISRYTACYSGLRVIFPQSDFFNTFFGVNANFSPEQVEQLNGSAQAVFSIHNGVVAALQQRIARDTNLERTPAPGVTAIAS